MSLFTLRCPHCGSLWPHNRMACSSKAVSAAISDAIEASRNTTFTWEGKLEPDLARDELVDAIYCLLAENKQLRQECDRMRPHINFRSYIMARR